MVPGAAFPCPLPVPLSALTLVSPPLLSCDRPRSRPVPPARSESLRAESLRAESLPAECLPAACSRCRPPVLAAPYEPSVGFMLAGFICMGVLFGCPILKIFKDKVKSKLEAKEQSGP